MQSTPAQHLVGRLRHAATLDQSSDADVLEAFLATRCESAFSELVRRHGPMVWGVSTRMLKHRQDAEDCYQATFLVLLRKASSVRPRSQLGAWLHGVAYHTALKARDLSIKRGHMEKQLERLPERIDPPMFSSDMLSHLDRELNALPDKYRVPIVLCELQGQGIKEAAQSLGCPIGTLAGRLSRGRDLLARRLIKHGVPFSAIGLSALIAQQACALPTLAPASSTALALAQATMRSLLFAKIKSMTLAATLLLFALGLGGWLYHANANTPTALPALGPIALPIQNADPVEAIAWGKPVDGIQYGVEIKNRQKSYYPGDVVTFVLKAKSVSDRTVRFTQVEISGVTHTAPNDSYGAAIPKVVDAKGANVYVAPKVYKGAAAPAKVREIELAPKEQATLGEVAYHVGYSNDMPFFDPRAGTHQISFDTVCWIKGHVRPTGALTIHVTDPVAWGPMIDNVEYGVEFKSRQSSYRLGDKATLVIKARCLSDKIVDIEQVEIATSSRVGKTGVGIVLPTVENTNGKAIKVSARAFDGDPPAAKSEHVRFASRMVKVLGEQTFRIGASNLEPSVDASAGTYRVRYDTVCWLAGKERPTGTLEMIVADPVAWGKAVDGVEYGVEFLERRNRYYRGDDVTLVLKARNVSAKPTRFEQVEIIGVQSVAKGGPGSAVPLVFDANGKKVTTWPTYVPGASWKAEIHQFELAPNEVATLGQIRLKLDSDRNVPGIDAKPGAYQVRYDTVCWIPGHQRPTGALELIVVDRTAWGKPVDGVEYGVEFKDKRNAYMVGERATFVLKARNVTEKEIAIEQVAITGVGSMARGAIGAALPTVTDAYGRRIEAHHSHLAGFPAQGKILDLKIPPLETITIGEIAYSIGKSGNTPSIYAGPGFYRVKFDTVCWLPGHVRPTGVLELIVPEKAGLLELYEKIKTGMSKDKVEAVLGKPVTQSPGAAGEMRVYYLGSEYAERKLLPQESPFMPAGIRVIYMDGRLVEKAYNPQWIK